MNRVWTFSLLILGLAMSNTGCRSSRVTFDLRGHPLFAPYQGRELTLMRDSVLFETTIAGTDQPIYHLTPEVNETLAEFKTNPPKNFRVLKEGHRLRVVSTTLQRDINPKGIKADLLRSEVDVEFPEGQSATIRASFNHADTPGSDLSDRFFYDDHVRVAPWEPRDTSPHRLFAGDLNSYPHWTSE